MSPPQSSANPHEQVSFGSYTSYIGNILNEWPEYHWLHQRLRSLSSRDISFVTIWDFKGEAVSCDDFACGENGGEVANTLKNVAADVSSRVVLLNSKAWHVNKPFLDRLGLIYDIDPLFFWRHLEEVGEDHDDSSLHDHVSEDSAPHGFVTDSSSTHFGFRLYLHASITEVNGSPECNRRCPTVFIMLSENSPYQDPERPLAGRSHSLYTVLLERPSCTDSGSRRRYLGELPGLQLQLRALLNVADDGLIALISQYPLAVILPLMTLHRAERLVAIQREVEPLKRFMRKDFLRLERYLFETSLYHGALSAHRDSFRKSIRSLTSLLPTASQQGWDDRLEVLLNEMEHISALTDEGLSKVETYMDQWSTKRSLQDSRESIKFANSAGRITVLAFFYIPLSFITSFFGMNLAVFGSGDVEIGTFVTTVIVLTVITLLVWFFSALLATTLRTFRARLGASWEHRRFWKVLATKAPLKGFWLLAFGLAHDPGVYEYALVSLGFKNLDRPDGPWDPARYSTDVATLNDSAFLNARLTPFWIEKVQGIVKISGTPGWYKH